MMVAGITLNPQVPVSVMAVALREYWCGSPEKSQRCFYLDAFTLVSVQLTQLKV